MAENAATSSPDSNPGEKASGPAYRSEQSAWWDRLLSVAAKLLPLIIACIALWISYQANEISRDALSNSSESLDIARREFGLRNRPFIEIPNPKLGKQEDETVDTAGPYYVRVEFENRAPFPATDVAFVVTFFEQGRLIRSYSGKNRAIGPNSEQVFDLPLSLDEYSRCVNAGRDCTVRIECTYSGLLVESETEYRTRLVGNYSVTDVAFLRDSTIYE